MPGEAPAEQAEDGTGAEKGKEAPAEGEGDPTVQTKDSPGGHTDETDAGDETAGAGDETATARKWGVTWFNEKALAFINKPGALLGPPGGLSWFMPGEDAAGLRSVADVARETGIRKENRLLPYLALLSVLKPQRASLPTAFRSCATRFCRVCRTAMALSSTPAQC